MHTVCSEAEAGQTGFVDDFNAGEGDDGSSSESDNNDIIDGNQVVVDYDNAFTDDSSEIFYYNDVDIDSVGEEMSLQDDVESLGEIKDLESVEGVRVGLEKIQKSRVKI